MLHTISTSQIRFLGPNQPLGIQCTKRYSSAEVHHSLYPVRLSKSLMQIIDTTFAHTTLVTITISMQSQGSGAHCVCYDCVCDKPSIHHVDIGNNI